MVIAFFVLGPRTIEAQTSEAVCWRVRSIDKYVVSAQLTTLSNTC